MRFAVRGVLTLASAVAAVILVAAPVAAQSSDWQPGPGAILDNTYAGFIDVPGTGTTVPGSGSFTVSGWFVDKLAQGWAGADDVQVWLGTMDGGGRMLAKANFAQSRPDVAAALGNPFWAASGFVAAVPGLPGGSQTINVYAHTGGKGWWFKGVTVNGGGPAGTASVPAPGAGGASGVTLVILNPVANSNVSTKSDYTITGTVTGDVDKIEIWINGERNTQYASSLGTTNPQADGSWSLTFTPTHFPSTHSNIYVYAHSRSGAETLGTREFNIVDK